MKKLKLPFHSLFLSQNVVEINSGSIEEVYDLAGFIWNH